jgi:hypothetical protein
VIRTRALILFTTTVALAGCQADLCKGEPSAVQLDLAYAAGDAAQLHVVIELADRRWQRTFPVGAELSDGETSLAVTIDPALTSRARVRVTAEAWGPGDVVLARAAVEDELSPDACNRVALTLTRDGPDGGPDDGGPTPLDGGPTPEDATPTDGPGTPDAQRDATTTDAQPDAGVTDTLTPDALVPDTGGRDAAAPDALAPDATPVDAGPAPVPFAYTPSNFEPAPLQPTRGLVIDCGRTVVFDSSALTFTNACGPTPTAVVVMQRGNIPAALVPVTQLVITANSGLRITGTRPVIFAVFGEVSIAGRLSTAAELARPGAGGGLPNLCQGAQGEGSGGRGGGGGGGFASGGASGGRGGDGRGGGSAGGVVRLTELLVPLRGGCSGGTSAPMDSGAGGGGGGAVQISAASRLTVSGSVVAYGGGGGGGAGSTGGGGGGSGGAVLIEASQIALTNSALLDARGGGGGGGGDNGNTPGSNGSDGSAMSPIGGAGGGGAGGAGGDGADGNDAAGGGRRGGSSGSGSGGGGGGGGGGLGRVRLRADNGCQSQADILAVSTGC